MNAEFITGRNRSLRDTDDALNEIKDNAIMLSIAGKYLCKSPFLKKAGFNIAQNVAVLENHIEDLKKQFVGKPDEETRLKDHLEGIADISDLLKKADNGIKRKCIEGALGRDLSEKVISLANATNALREKIQGRSVSYTWIDSLLRIASRLKFIMRAIAALYKFCLKILGLFIIICLMAFSYLFFTMEKEKDVLTKIAASKAHIRSSQDLSLRISEDLTKIRKRIDLFRGKDLTRRDQMELVYLNLKAYNLVEDQEKKEAAINIQEEILGENEKKLEEMRQKSFLEKLLRR